MDREIDVLNYLPNILKEFREFKTLATAKNPELIALWAVFENIMDDQFVNDATENGVKRWESMLQIVPRGTDTLDVRRFRILARLNEQLPYTYTTLEQQLAILCGPEGYKMELQNDVYTLKIRIEISAKRKFDEVEALTKRVTPANMIVIVELLYNQHQLLGQHTHAQLSAYTHEHLRNEVII